MLVISPDWGPEEEDGGKNAEVEVEQVVLVQVGILVEVMQKTVQDTVLVEVVQDAAVLVEVVELHVEVVEFHVENVMVDVRVLQLLLELMSIVGRSDVLPTPNALTALLLHMVHVMHQQQLPQA